MKKINELPNPHTLRLKEMAQALLKAHWRTQRFTGQINTPGLGGGEILREAEYWEELFSLGASPNITLDKSIAGRNSLHLGGLACCYEPLFVVYQKYNGPLDFVEKDTSHEYVTLPKKVVNAWRHAIRQKQKMMDKDGKLTILPDDWAFEKIMLLKNNGITTTLTGLKGDTILDDVLTHEFLLHHNNNIKGSGELLKRLMEQGLWFNPKEEKELYKGGVREILPHIYNMIETFLEKKALQEALLPIQETKVSTTLIKKM